MVVVGVGPAGSMAAIEAAVGGADILVLVRFGEGGASARSGGIVDAGGGDDGSTIGGLYAVGRCAAGVASRS